MEALTLTAIIVAVMASLQAVVMMLAFYRQAVEGGKAVYSTLMSGLAFLTKQWRLARWLCCRAVGLTLCWLLRVRHTPRQLEHSGKTGTKVYHLGAMRVK